MKKIIIFLSLVFVCCFGTIDKCEAKSFIEERNYKNMFNFTNPDIRRLIKLFTKVTDEDGNLYFEVSPLVKYDLGYDDYIEKPTTIDEETLKEISQIIYFGSKYRNTNDKYYFAIQYLIYDIFDNFEFFYMQDENGEFIDEEIADIKNNMKTLSFSLTDFTTKENIYEITDKYVVDNFKVEGDNISVVYQDKSIIIKFLNELEEYELHFIPKNNCQNIMVWTSHDIELLNMEAICESEHKVTVNLLKDEKENVEFVNDQESLMNTNQLEEVIEVRVPNTSKNSYAVLGLIILLGNIYYVFKK